MEEQSDEKGHSALLQVGTVKETPPPWGCGGRRDRAVGRGPLTGVSGDMASPGDTGKGVRGINTFVSLSLPSALPPEASVG